MNSNIKQQWVNALRSNEYSQGVGQLQNTDGFCCLGVLCDLYAKETGTEWEDVSYTSDYYVFMGESAYLPVEVKEWAGLNSHYPHIRNAKGHLRELATLNDTGVEFTEIAQMIEEQY